MYKVLLALLLVGSLASCSNPKVNMRSRVLETNTIMLIQADKTPQGHTIYMVGDTVWVNVDKATVDNADSTAMLAVVETVYH